MQRTSQAAVDSPESRQELLQTIRESVIGRDLVLDGPYGPRRVIYADYTASGRSLSFLEDFLRLHVMPAYANTHSESSGTGRRTTALREQSRETIRRCVNGTSDDLVVFTGSGATGAIDKLIRILDIRLPDHLDRRFGFRDQIPEPDRPVVFVGPYEHHSNEVLWRKTCADVVRIEEHAEGGPDLQMLDEKLREYAGRKLKIGTFSAASNVTGILTDVRAVTQVLRAHGAYSFWDYAAGGPYLEIDMNPVAKDGTPLPLDAVFVSPHKFVGGPGTPGVLIAKRHLFRNAVPTVPGGGTVTYVSPFNERFLDDPVHREEGGTPAILESIRAGLVFQLKSDVGVDTIREREEDYFQRAVESWSRNKNLWILGDTKSERLSIVSLVIRHGPRFLHWNYIVALLDDLFGIQARGGCSCAGPYGHRLFHIDDPTSRQYQIELEQGYEGIKPGWFRMNFNYFISEAEFQYLLEAVHLVANEGWRLLPQYEFDPRTSLWRHRARRDLPQIGLADVNYRSGAHSTSYRVGVVDESDLGLNLERARAVFAEAAASPAACGPDPTLPASCEKLRWFPLPSETAASDQSVSQSG